MIVGIEVGVGEGGVLVVVGVIKDEAKYEVLGRLEKRIMREKMRKRGIRTKRNRFTV